MSEPSGVSVISQEQRVRIARFVVAVTSVGYLVRGKVMKLFVRREAFSIDSYLHLAIR